MKQTSIITVTQFIYFCSRSMRVCVLLNRFVFSIRFHLFDLSSMSLCMHLIFSLFSRISHQLIFESFNCFLFDLRLSHFCWLNEMLLCRTIPYTHQFTLIVSSTIYLYNFSSFFSKFTVRSINFHYGNCVKLFKNFFFFMAKEWNFVVAVFFFLRINTRFVFGRFF